MNWVGGSGSSSRSKRRRPMRWAATNRAKVSGLLMVVCAAWARRSSKKAIRATAIWMRTAFSEVPRNFLILSTCLTQRKNSSIAQAQKELETAVPLMPNNADEYYYLGLAHMQQADYAQAEPYFRKAVEMFGAKPGFHYSLATSLEKQGKLKAAREELREEWKINPDPQVKQDLERVEKLLAASP